MKLSKILPAMLFGAVFCGYGSASAQTVSVTINRSSPLMVSKLALGMTHAESDLDTQTDDPTAAADAIKLVNPVAKYQTIPIYEWGTSDPEPSLGNYAFENLSDVHSLRSRIKYFTTNFSATPVITLCSCSSWMKGGSTDVNVPPDAADYQNFANLAGTISNYFYPLVKTYQVWNELKGFYNADGSYNMAAYYSMYNLVYAAIKAKHPDIQVGGPYLVLGGTGSLIPNPDGSPNSTTGEPLISKDMTALTTFKNDCTTNNDMPDFLVVDRALTDYHDPNDPNYTLDQKLSFTHTFQDIIPQLNQMFPGLAVWYTEYYISTPAGQDPDTNVLHASSLLHMILGGASVAQMWQPMESSNGLQALFTSAINAGGGQATSFFTSYYTISNYFPAGTQLYTTSSSSTNLEVIASATHTLLVNKSNASVTVNITNVGHGPESIPLTPYQVWIGY